MDSRLPTIDHVAAVLALAPRAQPWRHEAPCRHLIRQVLCHAGWKWWGADRRAFVLVARAREKLNIRAPVGGDSDYDLSSWSGSADCTICDQRFIPRRSDQETCSEACRRRQRYLETRPAELRRCEKCRDWMAEPRPNQRYCSSKCRKAAQAARGWERHKADQITFCQQCGETIPPTIRADAMFCSYACQRAAEFAKRRGRRHAAREAADREVPRYCAHCATPLPVGVHLLKVYCSNRCVQAAYHRRKLNGAANGRATNGHAADPEGGRTRKPAPIPERLAEVAVQSESDGCDHPSH